MQINVGFMVNKMSLSPSTSAVPCQYHSIIAP